MECKFTSMFRCFITLKSTLSYICIYISYICKARICSFEYPIRPDTQTIFWKSRLLVFSRDKVLILRITVLQFKINQLTTYPTTNRIRLYILNYKWNIRQLPIIKASHPRALKVWNAAQVFVAQLDSFKYLTLKGGQN